MKMIFLIMSLMAPTWLFARERSITRVWCQAQGKAEAEYIFEDKTRVDCLTEKYAVEAEWAPTWKGGTGQAIHYARKSGQDPAILILRKGPKDDKYIDQAKASLEVTYYRDPDGNLKRIKLFILDVTITEK